MTRGRSRRAIFAALVAVSLPGAAWATGSTSEDAAQIVRQIQRADYEGNQGALERLYTALAPFAKNKQLAS